MSGFSVAAGVVTLAGVFAYINHRFIRLPTTIGLMMIALIISVLMMILGKMGIHFDTIAAQLLNRIDFDQTVMNGMLSFLLFAGALHVNINDLVAFHKSHGKAMTMTSAQPEGRFGALNIEEDNQVTHFLEKPKGDGGWINAGYFVCEPKVFDYITEGDGTVFEQTPLKNLAEDGEIYTFKHNGFWRPMDTLRDKQQLQKLWEDKKAPWKFWFAPFSLFAFGFISYAVFNSLFEALRNWPDRFNIDPFFTLSFIVYTVTGFMIALVGAITHYYIRDMHLTDEKENEIEKQTKLG